MSEPAKLPHVLVLGGGTAGFLSALTLRRRLPSETRITVLQSSKLGVIGVGEGSLRQLPDFLHNYLGIDPDRFVREVGPTWKLGIRFRWGSGGAFNYTFSPQVDAVHSHPDLHRPTGYYCWDTLQANCIASVMMDNDLICLRDKAGKVMMHSDFGYHLDNRRLAAFLERYALDQGVELVDDLVVNVGRSKTGVTHLDLESGNRIHADLYVDCSGFASILLEKTLREPFVSYRESLFCDRAVIGGWERSEEPVHPYTTSETMQAGWCWQIEHEERINRGYVYASAFIDDDQAEREFRAVNPDIDSTNLVHFRSGRFERAWVKNVVAIGNSAGFVEPLEATAIAAICTSAKALAETLALGMRGGALSYGASARAEFNRYNARSWDTIADFLAVHYRFNDLYDNEFWRACRNHVDLRGAQPIVDHYREFGPSQLWRLTLEDPVCRFRLDGYYTLLLGQKVPFKGAGELSQAERTAWPKLTNAIRSYAAQGLTVRETLDLVRSVDWTWRAEHFAA